MAAVLLRRSLATAAVATLATGIVPLAASFAAPAAFAASSITTNPQPDSNKVVHANRPTVVATFNASVKTGSISLVVKGTSTNLCGTPTISGSTVSCAPTSDLDESKTYDAVGRATNSSGVSAKTATLEFTVAYPSFQPDKSFPVPNGAMVSGGDDIVGAFDEPITGTKDTFAPDGAVKVFEVNSDGTRGIQLPGTISFPPKSPVDNTSNGTVQFAPNGLSNGKYEVVLSVYGVNSSGKNSAAHGSADYFIYVSNLPPFNLTVPPPPFPGGTVSYANNTNVSAFPLSGYAPPGLNVHVEVINNPSDPTGVANAKGDVIVPSCATAPSCPWTATVDISNGTAWPDKEYGWKARTEDPGDSSTASPYADGPKFTKDTSAPSAPTSTTQSINQSSTFAYVNVSAQASDTTVHHYRVTITDPSGNKVDPIFSADGGNDLPTQQIDVSSLNDGTLTVVVQTMDDAGNVSDAPGPIPGPPTLTKNQGVIPNLSTSVLTSSAGDTTFQDAETQSVLTPTSVTLKFTQQIKLSYTDNTKTPPKTTDASLCVLSTQGNCLASGSPTLTKDSYGMTVKLGTSLPDGKYEVSATAFSKDNCPNVNPPSTDHCEKFSDVVRLPGTGSPGTAFVFTVDTSKPNVAITSFTNPVTADSVHNVSVSGTTDKDTTSVQLLIRSSGSTTAKFLANATIDANAGTWTANPLDLSSLPDGTLTIKATAKKSNGLSASDTATAQMQAHLSTLTELASRHRVAYKHAVQIHGHLSDANGQPISGAEISVRPRFADGSLGKAVVDGTDSTGAYTVTFVPRHNATYIASYGGSPDNDAVKNSSARVLVHVAVRFSSPNAGSSQSSPVTLKGAVLPHKHGKVAFYRHTSHGNVLLGRDSLNSHSRFTFRAILPPGANKIIAKFGKTRTNLGGKGSLRIHVS